MPPPDLGTQIRTSLRYLSSKHHCVWVDKTLGLCPRVLSTQTQLCFAERYHPVSSKLAIFGKHADRFTITEGGHKISGLVSKIALLFSLYKGSWYLRQYSINSYITESIIKMSRNSIFTVWTVCKNFRWADMQKWWLSSSHRPENCGESLQSSCKKHLGFTLIYQFIFLPADFWIKNIFLQTNH